jgi:hypothetical protein
MTAMAIANFAKGGSPSICDLNVSSNSIALLPER